MVLFTSGSLLTWGKPLDASSGISPRYMSTLYSQLITSPFLLQTSYNDRVCFLFTWGRQMEKRDGSNVGEYQHLPLTAMVSYSLPYPIRTVLPEQPQGLGGEAAGLPWHHLPVGISQGGSYRGQELWSIDHLGKPCQARVPSMEEAVGKLTAWVSSGPNLPYALVQLHEDTCHAPLPKEGHLGILPQRGAEMTPCRQISQLEVCHLFISDLQVAYPIGLNGCEEESFANGISLTRGKSVYLELDILQSLAEEPDLKVPPIGYHSSMVMASPFKVTPLNQKERSAWPWR